MNKAMPNHRDKTYGGAWPVPDKDVMQFLDTVKQDANSQSALDGISPHKDFVKDYFDWFRQPHDINGIQKFDSLAFCNGSSEAFDKFYHKYMHKNLRFLRGEYMYHQIMAKRFFKNYSFIEDDIDITKDDVVVMSLPFSDTGGMPPNFDRIMETCEDLGVPVLLDLAYINLAKGLSFNVDYRCVDTITTSLSKAFPVAHWRIGLRMQQVNVDDTLDAYQMNSYINTHSVNVGHSIIKNYAPTYSYDKFRPEQLIKCIDLGLTPSQSFIFGIDYNNKYPQYNRGRNTNRLCFAKHFGNLSAT